MWQVFLDIGIITNKFLNGVNYINSYIMIQKISEINPNEIVPGYLGKFFHGKNMTIAFWKVKKNSKIPTHNHIHEQCLYVKKGSFKLKIDGKIHRVNENELIFIKPTQKHSGTAITNCELIDFFTPNRTEYSNK